MTDTAERRQLNRRKLTVASHVKMVAFQFIATIGFIGIGVILMSGVLFTESEFWANVERFFRW